MDSNILYEKLIEENMEKGFQVKLVVNEFKDIIYIQLRKYFLTYEGDWQASKEGISIPASIENIQAMLDGLLDICANNEATEIVTYYANKIAEKQT
ncbi:Transcriptional coactivator p15 (PC4) [uncultured Caudovirales phage]|uniref:Transcriptional coactivator p15 (PC4) n=1 Tax=uncultured Caudovirales phage TaxID=2100421 RepID=A0A6J7WLP4_9CAUD|nr:Transcriptional coactivator p15 (PC4) [uncultured Caudovirales phage]